MPAVAGAADLEFAPCRGASFDESSEESDNLALRRWTGGRVVRSAAFGSVAAVVLLCVLATRRAPSQLVANGGAVTGLASAGSADAQTAMQAAAIQTQAGYQGHVVPKEHLHDGNPCGDDEEFHDGVCYEKCSILAGVQYSYRQSAWTCCKQAVCTNLLGLASCCQHNMGFCSGFDIAGEKEGHKICPHKPGSCLADEELFLNICYMKCSLLTAGEYPYRTAAATCCKTQGAACMVEDGIKDGLDGQAITNASLAVGGGCGDASNRTHCHPHEVQQSLTES